MRLEETVGWGLSFFGVPVGGPAIEGLCRYVAELEKWNQRMNLVGFKDMESMVRELLYDAFFLQGHVEGSESVLDMGSGAGVLAVPLKILNRDMLVFSVDRTLKKIQFQRHIQRLLKLSDFHPIHGRIESLEPLDVQSLVVKAFGSITDILMKGGMHVKAGGRVFLLKGKEQEPESAEGFVPENVIPYALPESTKSRTLLVYRRH